MDELSGVRTGVTLILYQIILLLLAIAGLVLGIILAMAVSSGGLLMLVFGCAGLLAIAGTISGIIGKFMCMSAPAESGSKQLIISSVLCDLTGMLIVVGVLLRLVQESPLINSFAQLINLASQILFLVFLKKMALYINRSDIADKSQSVLNLMIGLFVCLIAMAVLQEVVAALALILGVVVLVLAILMLVRYIGLIVGMKAALERATGM